MPASKKTLLLVEDEVIIAMAGKVHLEKSGYSVLTANSGEKAVELFKIHPAIDLVLMDIDLGDGMDGIDAAKVILSVRDIPIVFVSSHSEPAIVEKTEQITSYGYVVKNSNTTVLVASIKMAFKLFTANTRLAATEAKQKNMISNISDVISIMKANGIITYVSPNIEKLFGWKSETIVGKSSWRSVHGEDIDRVQAIIHQLLKTDNASQDIEFRYLCANGTYKMIELTATNLANDQVIGGILLNYHDISGRKLLESALEKRIIALTQPLNEIVNITFDDLFDPSELQRIQDEFSAAMGVASIITDLNGIPITRPSNFSRLCANIIRCTEKGRINCFRSDALLGRYAPDGPSIQPCLSGGLWDAGASISIGGRHIGNWLIGQVRNESQSDEHMREYAREIGADETDVIEAFNEIPRMTYEQFRKVAQYLFTLANQLSANAYQNIQQARFISERRDAEKNLHDIQNKLKRIEDESRKSDQLLRTLSVAIDQSPVTTVITDVEGNIEFVNPKFEEITGYTATEVKGMNPRILKDESKPSSDYKELWDTIMAGRNWSGTFHNKKKNGEYYWESAVISPVKDETGKITHFLALKEDITERKKDEERINALLVEKELILREVHHRIKNNMNTIYGLLSLQAETLKDSAAKSALNDAGSRVKSMMTLYNKLYQSPEFNKISVAIYLPTLIHEIVTNFPNSNIVRITPRIDDFIMDVQKIQPLGIIINELLTNIMKYAFVGRDSGLISVSVTEKNEQVTVIIEDNGNGIPENIDFGHSTGFGLMLVGGLTKQINGKIRIERSDITRIILEFGL